MWLCEESSTMVNDKAWNLTVKGTPSFRLASRIKHTKNKLRQWNKHFFGHMQTSINGLNQQINTLQTLSQTLENLEKEAQLYLELEELLKREEIMWKEKSKQRWIEEGDANTHFFHLATIIQCRYNSIDNLHSSDSSWKSDWNGIDTKFCQYYSNMFTSVNPRFPADFECLILPSIPYYKNLMLCEYPQSSARLT